MKKNAALILAILSAVLLLGSLPIKWVIGELMSDICRIVDMVVPRSAVHTCHGSWHL